MFCCFFFLHSNLRQFDAIFAVKLLRGITRSIMPRIRAKITRSSLLWRAGNEMAQHSVREVEMWLLGWLCNSYGYIVLSYMHWIMGSDKTGLRFSVDFWILKLNSGQRLLLIASNFKRVCCMWGKLTDYTWANKFNPQGCKLLLIDILLSSSFCSCPKGKHPCMHVQLKFEAIDSTETSSEP